MAPHAARPWIAAAGALLACLILAAGLWTQLDLDGDGLDAWSEQAIGTDPLRADSDRDTLSDGWETQRGLDPLLGDTDADTIEDRAELEAGTDPRRADSDDDGVDDAREGTVQTDPASSDTDRDGLADGFELDTTGTDPRRADSETDGLDDARELVLGSNPWVADTDSDGLPDRVEVLNGTTDCNANGVPAIADADDDSDGRIDADERPVDRCRPDADGDGILDGREGNTACIHRTDCDVDGLGDATELGTPFDRLDPDTFDVGLLDSISWTFQQRGQPPSRDDDGDGIPDAWEQATGLIDWGEFDPEPGRADLLVEYVRVQGPDSSRLGPPPLTPTYEDVAAFFGDEGGIELQWVRTEVRLDEERRPPLIPSSLTSYYEEVLRRSAYAGNPYVTTVVMNPQHDASEIAHLGVAPIRGMLGAVDYGAHSEVRFRVGEQSFELSPFLESVIVADRQDILDAWGYEDGGRQPDGDLFVRTEDWTMSWRPFWFATPPTFTFEDGTTVNATRERVLVDHADLSDTVAHELGHTLGLCHLTLPDCQANLSQEDRDKVGVSTMDPRRETPRLALLDSEWDQVDTYLTCPPQAPVRLLAEQGATQAVLDAKYAVTLERVLSVDVRGCEDYDPLPATLVPYENPFRYRPPLTLTEDALLDEPTLYEPPAEDAPPARAGQSTRGTVFYVVGAGLVSLMAAAVTAYTVRRRSL